MRKNVLVATMAAAALVVACDSPLDQGASLAAENGPAMNVVGVVASATGSDISSFAQGVRQLTFTAQEQADGTVTGSYNFTTAGNLRQLRGTVVCMRVSGDRVFIVGDVRHDRLTDFPLPVGGIAIEAVDGGPGPEGDQISFLGLAATVEDLLPWCESGAPGPMRPIEHGQIRVEG